MSIFIFCRQVRSGKTTELLKWSKTQNDVAGILMPDINGVRKMLDLKTGNVFDAQCNDPSQVKEELITVGHFHFYKSAFEKANNILFHAAFESHDYIIIDEVGKLELGKKGFYDATKELIEIYQNQYSEKDLLLVVRKNLEDSVITAFKIKRYTVIHSTMEL
jgi:nucleoside-triphosphatase THEP1